MEIYSSFQSFFTKEGSNKEEKADILINKGGVIFPVSMKLCKSSKIVFFFPGAFNTELTKPKFQRSGYFDDVDCNSISFFDPTLFLSDSLSLGWFQGDGTTKYLDFLLEIVDDIKKSLNINNDDILFFGTSAGGLAALKIAQYFPKSNVYLGNIQTDVLKYYKPSVDAMIDCCFANPELLQKNIKNLNVFDINADINIFCAQNKADAFHYINHFLPFVSYCKGKKMHCEFIDYNDVDSGHNPISKKLEILVINTIFSKGNIGEIFSPFGFIETKHEDFLYQGGFFFSSSIFEPILPHRFSIMPIDNYKFYYDQSLPICYMKSHDKKTAILIYGYVIDLKIDSDSIEEIASELLFNLEKDESIFLNQLDVLNGRYIVMTFENDGICFYNDACGTKQIYYSYKDNELLCSSHARMIKDNNDQGLSSEFLISKNLNEYFAYGYPGNTTPFKNIFVLTPNTRLNYNEGTVVRYFPREDLLEAEESDFSLIADKIRLLFNQQMHLISKKYVPLISLTAGKDSRFTVAALDKKMLKKAEFFTYKVQEAHDIDYRVASDLANALDIVHHKLDVEKFQLATHDEFGQILDKNTYLTHGRKIAYMYREKFSNKNYLHVRSNISEIGRSFYGENKESCFNELSMLHLFTTKPTLLASKGIRDSFFSFYRTSDFTNIYNYSPYDMFYWEYRMGVWLPLVLVESDIAFDTFNPFNCRYILKLLLSLPENLRVNDFIYDYILNKYLDDESKNIPINPSVY